MCSSILVIVRQVVDRHGGSITAEESEDGGAMFRMILPGYDHEEDLARDAKNSTSKQLVTNNHDDRPTEGRAAMFRNAHDAIGK